MTTSTKPPSVYNEDDPCDEWKELDKLPKEDRDSPVRTSKRSTSRSNKSDT